MNNNQGAMMNSTQNRYIFNTISHSIKNIFQHCSKISLEILEVILKKTMIYCAKLRKCINSTLKEKKKLNNTKNLHKEGAKVHKKESYVLNPTEKTTTINKNSNDQINPIATKNRKSNIKKNTTKNPTENTKMKIPTANKRKNISEKTMFITKEEAIVAQRKFLSNKSDHTKNNNNNINQAQ